MKSIICSQLLIILGIFLFHSKTPCQECIVKGEIFIKFSIEGNDPLSGVPIYFIEHDNQKRIIQKSIDIGQGLIEINKLKIIDINSKINNSREIINKYEEKMIDEKNNLSNEKNIVNSIKYNIKILDDNIKIKKDIFKNVKKHMQNISDIKLLLIKMEQNLEANSTNDVIPQKIKTENNGIMPHFHSVYNVMIPKEITQNDRVLLIGSTGKNISIEGNLEISIINSKNERSNISFESGVFSHYDISDLITNGDNVFEVTCYNQTKSTCYHSAMKIKYIVPNYSNNFTDIYKNSSKWNLCDPLNEWIYTSPFDGKVFNSLTITKEKFKAVLENDIQFLQKKIANILPVGLSHLIKPKICDFEIYLSKLYMKYTDLNNDLGKHNEKCDQIAIEIGKLSDNIDYENIQIRNLNHEIEQIENSADLIYSKCLDSYISDIITGHDKKIIANREGKFNIRLKYPKKYFIFVYYNHPSGGLYWHIPIETKIENEEIILSNINCLTIDDMKYNIINYEYERK